MVDGWIGSNTELAKFVEYTQRALFAELLALILQCVLSSLVRLG